MHVYRPFTGLRLLSGLAALILSHVISAQPDRKITYDIPAQSLESALTQFGVQSKRQLVFDPDTVPSRTTPAVKGEYTPLEALDILIGNSGLTYSVDGKDTIIVRRIAAASSVDSALRLVQSDTQEMKKVENSETSPNQNQQKTEKASSETSSDKDQEVLVTGSHIRGAPSSSPMITLDRAYIERSGYTSVNELMKSLPQISGAGQNSSLVGVPGGQNTGNVAYIDSPNLRGLGSGATLTLVDGHRLAPSGYGSPVDSSMIPLNAIERVDIITDGASAIYGSDAVGGVVNFILRKDYVGEETSVAAGGPTRGGAFEQRFDQLVGRSWSSGNALLGYTYFQQDALRARQRDFTANAEPETTLSPEGERHSVFINGRQELSRALSVFAQGLYTERASRQGFAVGANFQYETKVRLNQRALHAGLVAALPGDWQSTTTLSAAREFAAAVTIDPAFGGNSDFTNSMEAIDQQFDGTLFAMPTGPLKAAFGAGYSSQALGTELLNFKPRRREKFGYVELRLPLVRPDMTRTGLQKLDIDASGRWEDYNDVGTSTNPRFGFTYQPAEQFQVKGTWSTSFRAPTLYNLNSPLYFDALDGVPDPQNPGGSMVAFLFGSTGNLQPETSTAWTISLNYRSSHIEGLELSAVYFDIDYKDLITAPITALFTSLVDPAFAAFVLRNPTLAQTQALIDQALQSGGGFFDDTVNGFDPNNLAAIVDDTSQNVAKQRTHGVDFSGRYNRDLTAGNVDFFGGLTWAFLEQQPADGFPFTRLSGKVFNVPELKARAGASWQGGPWSATLTQNYTDGPRDHLSTPNRNVSAWSTTDLQLAYNFESARGRLNTFRAALSVLNAFDRDPPSLGNAASVTAGINYDATQASALGRVVRLQLTAGW